MTDHLTGLLGNRLDLFGLELQEEIERLLAYLAVLLISLVFGGLALLFATIALLVLAQRNDCLFAAASVVAAVFGLLALGAATWLWRRVRSAAVPFAATRAEFYRDRAVLRVHPESES